MIEMKISLDVKNLDKVKYKMEQVEQAAEKGRKIGIKKAAFLMEREAKKNAPVDTGRYKSSIETTFENNNLVANVGPNVYYATYLEFGTGKYSLKGSHSKTGWVYNVKDKRSKYFGYHWTQGQKPQQIMTKTYDDNIERAKEIIREEIKKSINSVK